MKLSSQVPGESERSSGGRQGPQVLSLCSQSPRVFQRWRVSLTRSSVVGRMCFKTTDEMYVLKGIVEVKLCGGFCFKEKVSFTEF